MLNVGVSTEFFSWTENALRLGNPSVVTVLDLFLFEVSAIVVESVQFNYYSIIEEGSVELRVAIEDGEFEQFL